VVFGDFGELPPAERNLIREYFLNPRSKDFYQDWERAAKDSVAHLRKASAEYADDPELAELVAELTTLSSEFASWWSAQDVSIRSHCPKILNHPTAGQLAFSLESLTLPNDPGQTLTTYTPANPQTETALRNLLETDLRLTR